MGFHYKKFTLVAGDADFPAPSSVSNSDIRKREESIVKHFADSLILMDIGWVCDTSRNATTSNFIDVPKYSSTTSAPGLFLINNTSGCKLFISYLSGDQNGGLCFYDSNGTTKIFDDSLVNNLFNGTRPTNNVNVQGFIMSMIPAGSSNSFGSTFKASEFLPSDATRIIGTAMNIVGSSAGVSYYMNYANKTHTTGNIITFRVFATEYCVGLSCGDSDTGSVLRYFVGRIFGDLFDPTDTSIQAKYGTFSITRAKSDNQYDYISDTSWYLNYQNTNTYDFINQNIYTLPIIGCAVSCSNAFNLRYVNSNANSRSTLPGNSAWVNGSWISNTSSHGITAHVDGYNLACPSLYDTSSNSRPWSPIVMYFVSSEDNENPGIKGYLDTSLFRASPQFATGTTLDNGNFICTNNGGITLGWDPTNESW